MINESYSAFAHEQAVGLPFITYFVHNKSVPPFIPNALQSGGFGVQMQHAKGL
jgi:hypothetical protein